MIDLSIVIPAYNEEERIGPTLQKFHDFLSSRRESFEILVVDDGSTDGTVALVESMMGFLPCLSVISLSRNMGKGAAVRRGMLVARGAIRLFSDADGSTPITELDKLLRPLKEGKVDIAIGSRYLEQSLVAVAQPRVRVVWSRLVNRIVQRVLLPGIVDPHCGFKAFTAEAAVKVFTPCEVDGWSFDLEALAVAQSLDLRIGEVAVKWVNDARSKARVSQLPREFYSVYKIRKRLEEQRISV